MPHVNALTTGAYGMDVGAVKPSPGGYGPGRMSRFAPTAAIALICACGAEPAAPEPVRIVDLRTGREASFEAMVNDSMGARAVYVGEEHDRPEHHELQAAVVRALHRRDRSLAIGMEMFQRPFQAALDDWVAGRIDEEELLARTEWEERWGFGFEMYRPILEHAREHRIPVVALNAPREVTRAIARGGLEALTVEQRATLPELDLDDARHRALVEEALAGHHGMDETTLERFYTAQVVWDETMAEAVAETLAAPDAPRRMVVLAGGMHVREGRGIPQRAARRGAEPMRIVLPISEDDEVAAWRGPREERPADWLVTF